MNRPVLIAAAAVAALFGGLGFVTYKLNEIAHAVPTVAAIAAQGAATATAASPANVILGNGVLVLVLILPALAVGFIPTFMRRSYETFMLNLLAILTLPVGIGCALWFISLIMAFILNNRDEERQERWQHEKHMQGMQHLRP